MFQYPEIKKFLGLYLQKNSFVVPDGAMEQALNVVVSHDDVINKIRGFYTYFTPGAGTLNNLFFYQQKLMAIFGTKLSYFTDAGSSPNFTGTESVLTGATVAVTAPRRSRSLQAGGNLYMTSDNGILKVDAYNGKIFGSGSPPGLDLTALFDASNGPFTGDSEVAYRVVFGRRDANDNLLLGAPSDTLVLSNLKVTGVAWSRTTNVVTVTSPAHNLASGMSIVVSNSSVSNPVAAGTYTVTVTGYNTFTISSTAANDTGTLDYTATRSVMLETSIPSQITTTADAYFIQIYRSSYTATAAITPSPDFRLVEERLLTSAEITARVVFYKDEVEADLVNFATELYTNPNSREGELQANERPPSCQDLTLYKGYAIHANCVTRHLLNLDVIDTTTLASGDYIEVKVDVTTRRYVARTGVGNITVTSESTTFVTTTITVNYTAHGLLATDTIYVSNAKGTGTLPSGTYTVATVPTADSFTFTAGAAPTTLTDLDFEGVTNGTYNIFRLESSALSVAVRLRNTARGIVKAINRDSSSLVYARYISGITDVPGKMRFSAKGFTAAIYVRANTTTAGSSFNPPLPDSFASGTQVFSRNDQKPNSFFSSKLDETEAVPIANEFQAGPKNEAILRCLALRDSIIFLTEGGIYRTTGDGPQNFTTTILDNTVRCVAADSAVLLNNQVYLLSNQGICVVSESAVQILSRKIENVIEPVVGKTNVATQSGAIGYESDRTYRLSTIGPNDSTRTTTYLYNVLNDTWTESDFLFTAGVVGANDTLYTVSTANKILKERKNQNRIDYCAENFSVTVVSVASDKLSAVITSSSTTPVKGDVIAKDTAFSRIAAVTPAGSDYTLTFYRPTNLVAADTPVLYKAFSSRVKFSPYHAGLVGRGKQFSQLQIHTRTSSVTRLSISFGGQIFGSSDVTEWKVSNVISSATAIGWGIEPWGLFSWGEADGISTIYRTENAPVIRLWVPQFQQRSTFIQAVLEHMEAGEAMEIQALSWAVRAYSERVSK